MSNSERIECHEKGFERNWIEFDTRWTRRQLDEFDKATDATMFSILQPKVTALHIELMDGASIDRPQDFTYDQMQDADILLFGWAVAAVYTAIGRRKLLGNLAVRPSSGANAGKTPGTMDVATTPTPTN